MNDDFQKAKDLLRPLPWDSEHFAFSVAQVASSDLADEQLAGALCEARRREISLVYWTTHAKREIAAELLDEYCGSRVDRRATYDCDLLTLPETDDSDSPSNLEISEFPVGPCTPQIEALAYAAGEYSRFNLDQRIGRGGFEKLYRIWIQNSTLHEIADVVLAASSSEKEIKAMATVKVEGDLGRFGLIAVRQQDRGQGIGLLLMRAAHDWMRARNLKRGMVVTQLDNTAACRLYEKAGYRLESVRDVFHFWPMEKSGDE